MKELILATGKSAGHFIVKHSPTILTIGASIGVVATAVSSSKATLKANEAVEKLRYTSDTAPTKKEEFKAAFKYYIPTSVICAMTIACIYGSNNINSKRLEALGVAYALSESKRREYQQKIVDKLGEKKEEKIRNELMQDKLNAHPVDDNDMNVILTGNGNHLCWDEWSGRYFRSCWESLRHAENQVNSQLLNEWSVSVNDLYSCMNLPEVGSGKKMGWNTDKICANDMKTLNLTSMMAPNNEPCIVVSFDVEPMFDFNHNW